LSKSPRSYAVSPRSSPGLDEAREVVARLRRITSLVVPNDLLMRKPEDRELFLSGPRLAVDEAA
jgi:hypothetical protein